MIPRGHKLTSSDWALLFVLGYFWISILFMIGILGCLIMEKQELAQGIGIAWLVMSAIGTGLARVIIDLDKP